MTSDFSIERTLDRLSAVHDNRDRNATTSADRRRADALRRWEASLKTLAAVALLFCVGGLAAVAAQRIFTNPKPDAELKQLFPSAAAFSPLGGDPLHFKVYGTDPRADPASRPIGFAFWTTDLVPQEHGYHGPIHVLVGMDTTGTLTGVVV